MSVIPGHAVAQFLEALRYEWGGRGFDLVVWRSDYVPCPKNILTAGMMLTAAVRHVLECTQGT